LDLFIDLLRKNLSLSRQTKKQLPDFSFNTLKHKKGTFYQV